MTKDEALTLALKALKTIDEAMPFPVAKLAIKECEAALEAKDEPVAWFCKERNLVEIDCPAEDDFRSTLGWEPLYTTPPQRKPLTDEEIDKAWRSVDYTVPWDQHRIDIARAIEAAHGIKGEA